MNVVVVGDSSKGAINDTSVATINNSGVANDIDVVVAGVTDMESVIPMTPIPIDTSMKVVFSTMDVLIYTSVVAHPTDVITSGPSVVQGAPTSVTVPLADAQSIAEPTMEGANDTPPSSVELMESGDVGAPPIMDDVQWEVEDCRDALSWLDHQSMEVWLEMTTTLAEQSMKLVELELTSKAKENMDKAKCEAISTKKRATEVEVVAMVV
ncbi:hypothetical protein GUJ93_ZPchr0014g46561 [Zizania palustris]|uniref:Uncharacterized protein n=1 Tax=Zizania palustris TaxID=103762 RepID=A0A8J5TAW1_ZIZPA|nr:hypothetical protein GUJ93_ZPchr0014g46561 [Zizania palustris]